MAVLKYYDAGDAAWKYIAASTTANFTTWKKTMSGGETSVSGTDDNAVTLSYTVGLEQVFINGVLQVRGSDYTATNGTSVTGLTALVANDIVTVICYAPFNVANTIAPTVVDAKGDLIVGTAADTVGRLAVGSTNGQLLSVDSSTASGLKWINPGLTLVSTTSFSAVASHSVNDVFSATYDNYQIYINITSSTTSVAGSLRFRVSGSDNSSSNYENGTYAVGAYASQTAFNDNSELRNYFGVVALDSTVGGQGIVNVQNPFTTNYTKILEHSVGNQMRVGGGVMTVTTSYTGFTYIQPSGNFTGTISVYGYNK